MKTNRILTVVFSAFMMMGLGMGVASCSDSDKNEPGPGGGENEPQVENEQEELGWSLISQLTDERIAPAEWTDPLRWKYRVLTAEPLGKSLVLLSHEPGEALHRDAASISSSRGLLHIRVLWTSMQNPIQGVWDGA